MLTALRNCEFTINVVNEGTAIVSKMAKIAIVTSISRSVNPRKPSMRLCCIELSNITEASMFGSEPLQEDMKLGRAK